jgi:hypothetical protein
MKGQSLTIVPLEQQEAEQIAKEFIDYLNAFHEKGIQVDNKYDVKKRKIQSLKGR